MSLFFSPSTIHKYNILTFHRFNNHHRWSIILLCMCELYYSLQQHSCFKKKKIPSIIAAFCKKKQVSTFLSLGFDVSSMSADACLPTCPPIDDDGQSWKESFCISCICMLLGWMWKYLNIFVNIFNNNNANNMYNSLKYIYSYKCRE